MENTPHTVRALAPCTRACQPACELERLLACLASTGVTSVFLGALELKLTHGLTRQAVGSSSSMPGAQAKRLLRAAFPFTDGAPDFDPEARPLEDLPF